MKKFIALLIFGLLFSSTACLAADNELRFIPYYISPGMDEWEQAFGLEVQYVFWNTPNLGFALAGGIGKWNVDDSVQVGYDYAGKFDGSATTFPLGASVLYRPTMGGTTEITLEGGLRYVFINSDVDVAITDGYDLYSGSIDADDGLIGLLGVDVAFPVSPTMKLGMGLGYQFDISKGDVSIEDIDFDENEMKGFVIRLGMNVKI